MFYFIHSFKDLDFSDLWTTPGPMGFGYCSCMLCSKYSTLGHTPSSCPKYSTLGQVTSSIALGLGSGSALVSFSPLSSM